VRVDCLFWVGLVVVGIYLGGTVCCSGVGVYSEIAWKMYYANLPTKQGHELFESCSKNKIETSHKKDNTIPQVKCLPLIILSNSLLCCCPSKWYVKYRAALTLVGKDVEGSLDLVSFLRRIRMHGVMLTWLSDK